MEASIIKDKSHSLAPEYASFFLGPNPAVVPKTHRRGQPMQSEARNAKNAPESAICGVLPNRPAPTGSVLWLVPIPNPRIAPRREAGPICRLTPCGCGEVHRLADRARSDGHAPGELLADADLIHYTMGASENGQQPHPQLSTLNPVRPAAGKSQQPGSHRN
jgi:hypothetical protein